MYERFYNLRERPFALSPDPEYLYPSKVHKEALSYLRYGIEGHAGFVVITGEIGCGKTTMLQTVLRGLDRQTAVSRIVNTMLDARELIEAVMLDFGLDPGQGRSKPHLLHELARYLVDQRMAGRRALLVIDEAQNLTPAALEEVRMLSNLETEKSKLIQIILIGQPNLREVLSRPELEQLRQRVTVSYHLRPLDAEETAAYIGHRLKRAAIGAPLEFSRDVTDLIHLHSQGVPRKINVIADAILLFGYGEERRVIDVNLTAEVLEELEGTSVISGASTPAGVSAETSQIGDDQARRLAAREAELAERERRISEQERVLLEGYRRLRGQLVAQTTAPQTAGGLDRPLAQPAPATLRPASAPPPAPSPAALSTPAPAPEPVRTLQPPPSTRPFTADPLRRVGFWTKLRRHFAGAFNPAYED